MNVPKLRFKEFNDEWCKEYAGNLCSIQTGKSNTQDKTDDGIYPFYVRSPIIEKSHKFIFDTEAVLTVGDGVGVGKVFHYINGKFDCHQRVYMMNNFNKITAKYFYYIFSRDFDKRVMKMTAKTSVDSVRYEMIDKMQIFYPTVLEQNKISRTLELLDKKIELQTKKIEDLKLFKKGLILSLKKNSFDWHTVCIKDLFKITRGVVIPKNELSEFKNGEYKYPVYSSQTSNEGILGYSNTFDFNGKYLTWTTDGANAGKVFYRNGKFRCTNVCGVLYEDNIIFTNELFAELLNYETPKHVSYVGNPKLMNNVMADIKIKIPSSDVQENTSLIINTINNKVNLEKKKLLKFKELKKGLMQNMFV